MTYGENMISLQLFFEKAAVALKTSLEKSRLFQRVEQYKKGPEKAFFFLANESC